MTVVEFHVELVANYKAVGLKQGTYLIHRYNTFFDMNKIENVDK